MVMNGVVSRRRIKYRRRYSIIRSGVSKFVHRHVDYIVCRMIRMIRMMMMMMIIRYQRRKNSSVVTCGHSDFLVMESVVANVYYRINDNLRLMRLLLMIGR